MMKYEHAITLDKSTLSIGGNDLKLSKEKN